MWLSPRLKSEQFSYPLSTDNKIEIFIDRTNGWHLEIAEKVSKIPHSGFALMHIILSYFEMIGKYQDGYANKGKSEHYFKEGFKSVFESLEGLPEEFSEDVLSDIYAGARCGVYHGGFPTPKIAIAGSDKAILWDKKNDRFILSPGEFLKAIKSHFGDYSEKLLDNNNTDLRNDFEKRNDWESNSY